MGLSEAFYIPAGLSLIADLHDYKTRSLAIGIHLRDNTWGRALGGFGATISDSISCRIPSELLESLEFVCIDLNRFFKRSSIYCFTGKTKIN
jgi:hypothetical protein